MTENPDLFDIALVGYWLVLLVGQLLLGSVVFDMLRSMVSKVFPDIDVATLLPVYQRWFLGLLAHLSLSLLLMSVGLVWLWATILPFVLCAMRWRHLARYLLSFKEAVNGVPLVGLGVWCVFHCFLGYSLFSLSDGIRTPWVNNYGDLAFHLGMISQFAVEGSFPAQYHVYAGETLSYPFFVNFWSALLFWPSLNFALLPWVFMFQWLLVWVCVYLSLGRGKYTFLPWVILFGGGSYIAVFAYPDKFSWELIHGGFPWTTWLSTIWVTQRSAMMGLLICLICTNIVLNRNLLKAGARQGWHAQLLLAGCFLGLAPLAHTHFFVATSLFLGCYLAWAFFQECLATRHSAGYTVVTYLKLVSFQRILLLVVPSLVALVFFPLIMSKSSMVAPMLGWTVPVKSLGLGSIAESLWMWSINAWQWLLFVGLVWFLSRKHREFIILVGLFVVANLVKLAVWEWDQLKLFVALFCIFVVMCHVWVNEYYQSLAVKSSARRKLTFCVWAVVIVSVSPSVIEAVKVFNLRPNYQVYDTEKLRLADLVRQYSSEGDVIASSSEHNSAATLTGRRLYLGYPGTLYSHSLDYHRRESQQQTLAGLVRCDNRDDLCPTFLVWDRAGMKKWKRREPGDGFVRVGPTLSGGQGLFRIQRKP